MLPTIVLLTTFMIQSSVPENPGTELYRIYDTYRLPQITSRKFTQGDMLGWIDAMKPAGAFTMQEVGHSAEGRAISLLTAGSGPTTVLLWSQMHGDESTATMALLDILNFFGRAPDHPVVRTIREKLTILMLPMINPDGAQRFERRTAQMIDLNRDALNLRTPEARILKKVRDTYNADFGFNLHDQSPRYSVGTTGKVAAIGLLAPAMDVAKTDNPVRLRAKKVAASIVETLNLFIEGHIACYDDTFEPRAFGDNIQKWGTSTVLIESGGWVNDPEKMYIRKLNFVAILSALHAIATTSFEQADLALYQNLRFNQDRFCDLLIRGARVDAPGSAPPIVVDIGVNFNQKSNSSAGSSSSVATIVDVGDLRTFGAFEILDGIGLSFDSTAIAIEKKYPKDEFLKLIHKNQE